ncbi:MAG: DUF4097 domain-containing protein [Phycisphaerae bacterium]
MRTRLLTKVSLGCLLCLLTAVTDGCVNIGSWALRAKHERTVQLSSPLQPGSTFAAQTHNGSITIEGAEVTDCNLVATIIARAVTEEDAKKLAEEIKIKLEPSANKLTVKIEKPTLMRNRSVSVNLDVTVPSQTNLELSTHNGAVKIANIIGQVSGTTHNGGVTATQTSGTAKLRTHNGSITCKEISGDAQLRTHNGNVKAYYSESAQPVCNVSIVTHNGGIEFTAPPDFSAAVEASTHIGSIKTDIPITVIGKVSKEKLTGTIGTGQGKLHLQTHNGSIAVR